MEQIGFSCILIILRIEENDVLSFFFFLPGPPASVPPVSGSFSATGSGLYTPYSTSQGPPLTSVSQGLPVAQPPFPAQTVSTQRLPTQVPAFTPPPPSTGVGPSSYPPTTGAPRPPAMPGPPLPGQTVAGPPSSQPNHVSSPPPPSTMAGLHPGPPMSGLHGPPPPTHPPQPGYPMQQNGEYCFHSNFKLLILCMLQTGS